MRTHWLAAAATAALLSLPAFADEHSEDHADGNGCGEECCGACTADSAGESASGERQQLDITLPFISLFDLTLDDNALTRMNLFDIPLLRGQMVESTGGDMPERQIFADESLFRFFQLTMDDKDSGAWRFLEIPFIRLMRGDFDGSADESGFTFFASPVVDLYDSRWQEDRSSYAFVDTFLGPVLANRQPAADSWRSQILDFTLVKGYRGEGRPGYRGTRVLDLTVLEGFRSEFRGDDSTIIALNGPLFHGFRKKSDGDFQQTDILGLPFKALLYRHESDSDGGVHVRFLRLPLLGSFYENKNPGDRREIKLFWVANFKKQS